MAKEPKERKVGRRQPSQRSVELLIDADFLSERNKKTENCEYLHFKSYVSTIRIHISTHAFFLHMGVYNIVRLGIIRLSTT